MNPDDSIYVAGHRGMVGSALVRDLRRRGYENLLLPSRDDLDLTCQDAVSDFFARERPRIVIMAAARVGGIHANETFSGEFIYQNLVIATHVIEAARQSVFLADTVANLQMTPVRQDAASLTPARRLFGQGINRNVCEVANFSVQNPCEPTVDRYRQDRFSTGKAPTSSKA